MLLTVLRTLWLWARRLLLLLFVGLSAVHFVAVLKTKPGHKVREEQYQALLFSLVISGAAGWSLWDDRRKGK